MSANTEKNRGMTGVEGELEFAVSDGRELLLTLRCSSYSWAAFGQHGDLGAVVAVAACRRMLVLSVSTQEPL